MVYEETLMPEIYLKQVNDSDDQCTQLDVIFVHGLGGDAVSTWHPAGKMDAFWPKWLAEDLPIARVWSLGYPAAATQWLTDSSKMGVLERSRNILQFLSVAGLGTHPIIFVAHSLGGLMVKQLLRTASSMQQATWNTLASKIRGVVFLSTPHTGASLASLATDSSIVFRTSQATKDMATGNAYLQDLGDWFRQNASSMHLQVEAYYETDPVKGAITVVDAASANPGVIGCVPIPVDGDHFTMCKPLSRQSIIYCAVKKFIKTFLASKVWRIYSVPGYTAREVVFHEALRQANCWPLSSIIQEDSVRLNLTLQTAALVDEFAHVFVFDVQGINNRGPREVESMLDLIRNVRANGRELSQKPIFIFYGNEDELQALLRGLRPNEINALEKYLRLHPTIEIETLIRRAIELRNRIMQEWIVRPTSSQSAL